MNTHSKPSLAEAAATCQFIQRQLDADSFTITKHQAAQLVAEGIVSLSTALLNGKSVPFEDAIHGRLMHLTGMQLVCNRLGFQCKAIGAEMNRLRSIRRVMAQGMVQ